MAKRTRGTTSRPGQRRPLQRPATRPTMAAPAPSVSSRPSGLTAEEEARAAVLEQQIMAEERAAEESRRRLDERRRGPVESDVEPRRGGAGLGQRATQEYAYVGRDVRRITLLGGTLMGLLVILWAVAQATGSGSI